MNYNHPLGFQIAPSDTPSRPATGLLQMQQSTISWDMLPAETILCILGLLDDSHSLAALLRACSRSFRLFSVDGGQLLDVLVVNAHSVQVAQLVCSTALLRSCPATFFRSDGAASIHEALLLHIGQIPDEETGPPVLDSLLFHDGDHISI